MLKKQLPEEKTVGNILNEIAEHTWQVQIKKGCVFNYSDENFQSIITIFASALMEKLQAYGNTREVTPKDQLVIAQKALWELQLFIKGTTGVTMRTFPPKQC